MSGALNETPHSAPLSLDEFASCLAPFGMLGSLIGIAVSGGPDSMALAVCAQKWATAYGHHCLAFIVDHRMREESTAEATQVAQRLAALGIKSEILSWEHAPLTQKRHEQARNARYSLLTKACIRHNIKELLLGHHRDDQIETILMRLCKGSAIDGLCGMEALSARDDVRLLRPFLNFPKTRLIATCAAAALDYTTDPSNSSEKYARGRLRKIIPLLATEGLSSESLLLLGAHAREARDALHHATHNFLEQCVTVEKGAALRVDLKALRTLPHAIAKRALFACLRFIHSSDYPPEQAALSALLDSLNEDGMTRTLYGCLISTSGSIVTLLREPAAITEIIPFETNQPILWDRRWVVIGRADLPYPLTLRALGTPTHEAVDRLAPHLRHDVPQGRVRAGLPALWHGDSLWAIPSFDRQAPLSMHYRNQAFPLNPKMN